MNFEQALGELKSGAKVQRASWDGKAVLELRDGRDLVYTDLTKAADNETHGWMAGQVELTADDWKVAPL